MAHPINRDQGAVQALPSIEWKKAKVPSLRELCTGRLLEMPLSELSAQPGWSLDGPPPRKHSILDHVLVGEGTEEIKKLWRNFKRTLEFPDFARYFGNCLRIADNSPIEGFVYMFRHLEQIQKTILGDSIRWRRYRPWSSLPPLSLWTCDSLLMDGSNDDDDGSWWMWLAALVHDAVLKEAWSALSYSLNIPQNHYKIFGSFEAMVPTTDSSVETVRLWFRSLSEETQQRVRFFFANDPKGSNKSGYSLTEKAISPFNRGDAIRALIDASIQDGDQSRVQLLGRYGPISEETRKLISDFAQMEQPEVFERLLDSEEIIHEQLIRATIQIMFEKGRPDLLIQACQQGKGDIVDFLCAHPKWVDHLLHHDFSDPSLLYKAFKEASSHGHYHIVMRLLRCRYPLNDLHDDIGWVERDSLCRMLLSNAKRDQAEEVVNYFASSRDLLLRQAVEQKNFAKIKQYLSVTEIPPITGDFWSELLCMAATHGYLDIVKYLISMRWSCSIDPTRQQREILDRTKTGGRNKAFQSAVDAGQLEIVKFLVSYREKAGSSEGASYLRYCNIDGIPKKMRSQGLLDAAHKGHWEIVKYLDHLKGEPSISRATRREMKRLAESAKVDISAAEPMEPPRRIFIRRS